MMSLDEFQCNDELQRYNYEAMIV